MKSLCILCGGLLLTGVFSCMPPEMSHAGGRNKALKTITATEKDHQDTVRLARKSELLIQLKSLPGAGYRWEIKRLDTGFLESLGDTLLPLSQDTSPMVGRPQYQLFRFRAKKRGLTFVELLYRRPWETKLPPKEIYRLGVRIF